ncbi:MAG: hypothetical protein JXL84_14870 [Deltaproteobacteria bacterium]|nr:hypothetical protein [Deltaproteobacteria bacterium]
MKRKGRRSTPWFWILAVAVLAMVAGYFLGKDSVRDESRPAGEKEAALPPKGPGPKVEAQMPARVEPVQQEGSGDEAREGDGVADCQKVREEVREFFRYLDRKPYVRQIEERPDTHAWFRGITEKLAAHPPAPAGEGLDTELLAGNAFHFFRRLEGRDLRLIREILLNEASTLEANLQTFYQWLTLRDRCPDPEEVRPSPEILYSYAGLFLNTLGGQAYLFRRSGSLRVLVSYYCLLILHDAEKKGKNRYGIDLSPHVNALAAEMRRHGELLYQKEYSRRLSELQRFYPIRKQEGRSVKGP